MSIDTTVEINEEIERFIVDAKKERWSVYTHKTISVGKDHDYDPEQVNIYIDERNVSHAIYNLKSNKYKAFVFSSDGTLCEFESSEKSLSVSILKTFLHGGV